MEQNQNLENKENTHHDELRSEFNRRSKWGRIWGGLVIIGVGLIFLMKQMGYEFPEWLFTWNSLGVAACLFWGAKHMFRPGLWIINY